MEETLWLWERAASEKNGTGGALEGGKKMDEVVLTVAMENRKSNGECPRCKKRKCE